MNIHKTWCSVAVLCLWTVLWLYFGRVWGPAIPSTVPPPNGLSYSKAVQAYLVNTPGCLIPYFTQEEVLRGSSPLYRDFVCSTKSPLTEQEGQHLLFIKHRVAQYNLTEDTLGCEYQATGKDKKKEKIVLGKSVVLQEERILVEADAVLVTCFNTTGANTTVIYKEFHIFVQPSRAQGKREQFKERFGSRSEHPEKLSVVVVGTDSVSRFNAIRNMPSTFHYLTHDLAALDFQGYNKIGLNTVPNVIPIMTGYFVEDLKKLGCLKGKKNYFDDCPVMWKYFAEAGYVTAFGEDVTTRGIFEYSHGGFTKPPVDYYVSDSYRHGVKLGHKVPKYKGFNYSPCMGSKLKINMIHDHVLDLAEELTDVPYFVFSWTGSLTHDRSDMAPVADEALLKMLKQMNNKGYLNHTVVFLISDHGLRYGKHRRTYIGEMEVNLPFVFAVFPPWFKVTYPEAWASLVKNTKRLVSNLDLHHTFRSLAAADFTTRSYRPSNSSGGQSLLREVPEDRTCADVGIPERFCACEISEAVNVSDPGVVAAAQAAAADINLSLEAYPECVHLHLDKVISARLAYSTSSNSTSSPSEQALTYRVGFQTRPGGAMLEAMVRRQKKKYSVVGEILRTNIYGNQSHCIPLHLSSLKNYCYCQDLLGAMPKPATTT